MEPLRATFLPLAVAGIAGRADGVAGLAVLGKFNRPRNPGAENRRGVCAGGGGGLVYGLVALAFKIPAAKEMMEFALAKFKTRN